MAAKTTTRTGISVVEVMRDLEIIGLEGNLRSGRESRSPDFIKILSYLDKNGNRDVASIGIDLEMYTGLRIRLIYLSNKGYIEPVGDRQSHKDYKYRLTPKGRDAIEMIDTLKSLVRVTDEVTTS